ncbi:HAD-IA family hydrolase [Shewanella fidelis]|uniref:HAD-IA family hydrolase n=1 Tax=Shewanella fidelis TaxID=173509 RepID=A0AAW8NNS0_9GAMM|nr:HAD-IA family hydrolase [Shewanella fidelis]MDR8524166.1 HAD-IA family hydrolase [Shewanella fidelis]MDW4810713.1 HAD-IA family hydrolase [Shewanella fidelis]MDW4814834.1 HAD-IA family hydrolase [Shewanella fidelis]MDW4818924.1 HAD-IA family hydrolase [Shewanella fidelis]MDW4823399.1 HAD-IA family hydrolase [Shewanella fidelis]
MKPYELVIFDWDGTLMDSVSKIVTCMQQMATAVSIEIPSEQAVRDVIGLSMEEAFKVLYPLMPVTDFGPMINSYKDHYLTLNKTPSPLFDGSELLLNELSSRDYRLAVATGKGRNGLNRVLSETGLGRHFESSRCADESKSKPNPDMILELLEELKVSPNRALMVGDSLHDLNMANNAGVDAVGVSYGAHSESRLLQARPKAIIHHPTELLTICE